MAVKNLNGHPLSEVTGLSDALVARLGEQWVMTVEEAVAWLAAEGREDAEMDVFLAKARELLGEDMVAKLVTSAPEKMFGCELPDETKPDETEPDETEPDETEPDETEPDEAKSDEPKPDETKEEQS